MHNGFPELSIKQLLAENRYSVPRYQRNYAWTEEHIKQLIDDILDNTKQAGDPVKPYYLGTLVVFPRQNGNEHVYEVIDGQQRLTTLTLLASYITLGERYGNGGSAHWFDEINLGFESRKNSSETLKAAHNGYFHDSRKKVRLQEHHTKEIADGYEIIKRVFPERCKDKGVKEESFREYFLENVRICRVDVPGDTDLNHYFEIMNNRGEQLEKHEVLKARLLNKLSPGDDQFVFNEIWEACSDLSRYIQYGFSKTSRTRLFGKSWDDFSPNTTRELYEILAPQQSESDHESDNPTLTLLDLISDKAKASRGDKEKTESNEEEAERFSSIINFQNLLPHVLSIFLENGDVPLDDKQLLDSFGKLEAMESERIKDFSYALLKIRFLFDQNIIKRDATEDERDWSLKKLYVTEQKNPSYRGTFSEGDTAEGNQRRITLLQSMFHVSVPSRPYKYWLQGTLRYLYKQQKVAGRDFRTYLKDQAKAFVYNRFLSTTPFEYEEIIFTNGGKPVQSELDTHKTRYNEVENILIFNFIDYLLWESSEPSDDKIRNFTYTFRSSVEHYYPQNPIDGNPLSKEEVLHSVGNLCLISHSKNSLLRHHLPKAKAEYYLKQPYIDSVLQHKMLSASEEWSNNPEDAIKKNEEHIFKLLKANQP